jgi:hypothetical protein
MASGAGTDHSRARRGAGLRARRAGAGRFGARPILRVRIDIAGGSAPDPGSEGVTVDDCTRVSRALEEFLDEAPDIRSATSWRFHRRASSDRWCGPRDYERFAGREIA